jgi:hypothetical protein
MTKLKITFDPDPADIVHIAAKVEAGKETIEHNLVAQAGSSNTLDLLLDDGEKLTLQLDTKENLVYDAAQGTVTRAPKAAPAPTPTPTASQPKGAGRMPSAQQG